MPGSFFDTNVLIYSVSSDLDKAGRARTLIAAGGIISVQVLNEMVNVGRKKLRLTWPEIDRLIEYVRGALDVHPLTLALHETGVGLCHRYGFATYDAMIVAAALHARCEILWSEDMHDSLVVNDRLTIRNPFAGVRQP